MEKILKKKKEGKRKADPALWTKVTVTPDCLVRIKRLAKQEGLSACSYLDALIVIQESMGEGNTAETPLGLITSAIKGFDRRLASIGQDVDAIKDVLREQWKVTHPEPYLIKEVDGKLVRETEEEYQDRVFSNKGSDET